MVSSSLPPSESGVPSFTKRLPKRFLLVIATFLLSVLLYVDRICISVAKEDVQTDLGLTKADMGWIFAAFSLGYALCQTPSGSLADRYGPRRVLTIIVSLWSLFTGLTAVSWNFLSMLSVRFLFGVGEAGAFPCVARAVYSWIPMNERGIVQGINFSGSRLGAAFALPLIALMIDGIGWRSSFAVLMLIGFVWAVVWYVYFRDDPSEIRSISESELTLIQTNRQHSSIAMESGGRRLSLGTIIKSPNVMLLWGQYFASNFTFFFCLTWYFPTLKETYNLEGVVAAVYAGAPLICGAFGSWIAGIWIDRLFRSGAWVLSRRLPAIVGFVLATIGIVGSIYAQSPFSSSIWFCLSILGADMTLAPSWSVCIDIGQKQSGIVSGSMNMAGNLGSFVTSLAFPYLLAWTGSSMPFFFVAAGLNASAALMWLAIDPRKPLEPKA